jgi:hypothetical protein
MPIKDEPSYIGIVLLIVGGVYCVLAVCAVATIKLKNRFKKLYYKTTDRSCIKVRLLDLPLDDSKLGLP